MLNIAIHVQEHRRERGIHRLYGYLGDGINGFLGAFDEVGGGEDLNLVSFERIKVSGPDQVGPAWKRALSAPNPVLLEFVTGPEIPPPPPHVRPTMLKTTVAGQMDGDLLPGEHE